MFMQQLERSESRLQQEILHTTPRAAQITEAGKRSELGRSDDQFTVKGSGSPLFVEKLQLQILEPSSGYRVSQGESERGRPNHLEETEESVASGPTKNTLDSSKTGKAISINCHK